VQIAMRIGARVLAINRSRPSADSRLARLADICLIPRIRTWRRLFACSTMALAWMSCSTPQGERTEFHTRQTVRFFPMPLRNRSVQHTFRSRHSSRIPLQLRDAIRAVIAASYRLRSDGRIQRWQSPVGRVLRRERPHCCDQDLQSRL